MTHLLADTVNSEAAPRTLVAALGRLSGRSTHSFHFVGFALEDTSYALKDLDTEALRRAAHLAALGLRKGDRLAIVVEDGLEFVLSFVGAVRAGVVPVPISAIAPQKRTDHYIEAVSQIIETAGARALLVKDAAASILAPLAQQSTVLEKIVSAENAFLGETPDFQPPEIVPEDVCFLQFTSGSTSTPKGVVVRHRNLIANVECFLSPAGFDRKPDDVAVSWLPLFHDMGLIGFFLGPLIEDGPSVIISPKAFARDPRIWLRTIHKYRGTITCAPNFAYSFTTRRLRDQDIETLDLSCVRVAGCGAEPINAATLMTFADRVAPAGFRMEAFAPCYGMAEATVAISIHRPGAPIRIDTVDAEQLKRRIAQPVSSDDSGSLGLVSCGFSFPGHEIAIVDEDHQLLPDRHVGEIIAKGPSITDGYFGNEEATRETWRTGWLHTGDLGYLADGELYVCGRQKDLIIIRGANFFPQDIERSLQELPELERGSAVAFSVSGNGDERLVIVAEANTKNPDLFASRVAERVYETAGLEVWRVVPVRRGSLRKTSSGKVQRTKTKELFESGGLEEVVNVKEPREENCLQQLTSQ